MFQYPPIKYIEDIPVFFEPNRYTENYDKISADHIASITNNGTNPFIDKDEWQDMELSTSEIITRHTTDDQRILDAGVGLGRILSWHENLQRYGCDIALEYLKISKEKGITVACCELENLPYEDNYFDTIVTCDVLEHVFDLYAVSKQLIRVLRPGGTLIIRVPNKENIAAYLDYDAYEFVHVRQFCLAGLRLHFEKIFQLEYLEHCYTKPVYKGAPTLRSEPVLDNEDIQQFFSKTTSEVKGFDVIRDHFKYSSEDLRRAFNAVGIKDRPLYETLAQKLSKPFEINIVFRKLADPMVSE